MPRLLRFAVLAAVATVVWGCGRRARSEELPGTYVMNRGRAADTLVIQAGGTYVRRYTSPGLAPVTDSGTWSIETVTGEGFTTFEKFPARWHSETFPGQSDTLRGLWAVAAERTARGTVRLPVNDDLDWAYVRVGRP